MSGVSRFLSRRDKRPKGDEKVSLPSRPFCIGFAIRRGNVICCGHQRQIVVLAFFRRFLLSSSASPMRHLRLTGLRLKQQAHHQHHHHQKDLYRLFHPEDWKKKTDKEEEKKVSRT